MPASTQRIPFDQFVETTLGSLLRALSARKYPLGPIILGIIYRPEFGREFGAGASTSAPARQARRRKSR